MFFILILGSEFMNREMKKRFKMYKSGKNWVIAPIVFLGLTAGFGHQANVKLIMFHQRQKLTMKLPKKQPARR